MANAILKTTKPKARLAFVAGFFGLGLGYVYVGKIRFALATITALCLTICFFAWLDGAGLAFFPEDEVLDHIKGGPLVRVLEDWCPPFSGYHLYYPSRRKPSASFMLIVEALRYRD